MKKILVFGGAGQLGQSLNVECSAFPGLDLTFLSSSEADITQMGSLRKVFDIHTPDAVINCAAYTAVDLAEEEEERAFQINAQGAENLAEACADFGVFLVHVSTDFVFPGDWPEPLKEEDKTGPKSVYGSSKLKGEQSIQARLKDTSLIIRTGWLYSEFGHNFLNTMLRLGKTKDKLGVVVDQVGTPTYARDLASFILSCLDQELYPSGLFHFSNEGVASWYDFAAAIFARSGDTLELRPLRSKAYPTPAERPRFSVLDKSKAKEKLKIDIDHWQRALDRCMAAMTRTD